MNSMAMDGRLVAEASASNAQLVTNTSNRRTMYSLPQNPNQLLDSKARDSDNKIENVFMETARSITPPPGSTNWPYKNRLMITADATGALHGPHRPKKYAKHVSSTADSAKAAKIQCMTAHGGTEEKQRMIGLLLQSGEFDALVRERMAQIQNSAASSRSTAVQDITNKAELEAKQIAQKRTIVEKPKSKQAIRDDSNTGMMSDSISLDQLRAQVGGDSNQSGELC